jgi:3-dehydroquinate dehydratase-1
MASLSFDSFVLAAATADLEEWSAAAAHADAVEFRMDLAADPLAALAAYDGDLPVVATNRAAWEGGEAAGTEAERLDALATAAADEAVAAVDVELAALDTAEGSATAETARAHDAAVIASVHDFEGTPPASALRSRLHEAATRGDVGKLATAAADAGDALRLLAATHAATGWGDRVATMAMGAAGSHTRVVAPVYGSRIGYAPVDATRATAPGQFDLATLADLLDRLGVRT